MKRSIFTLLLVATSCLFANAINDTLRVYKTIAPPLIDGDISEWTGTWIDMAKAKSTNTTTAMSSQFQVVYTNDTLYIGVKVIDSTPNNQSTSNAHLYDCVEVFLRLDTLTRTSGVNGNNQFRLARNLPTTTAGNSVTVINGVNIKAQTKSDASGWTAEYAIPMYGTGSLSAKLSDFTTQTPLGLDAKAYPFLRFEIQVSDNTTGSSGAQRTQQQFWNNGADSQYGSMADQGFMKLMGVGTGNNTLASYKIPKSIRPVVNGDLSDWFGAWINLTKVKGTTNRASAKFQTKYTNDSLYVAVQVVDSTPNFSGSNAWERDCIELFVKMDTTSVSALNGADQYRLARGNTFDPAAFTGCNRKMVTVTDANSVVTGWNAEFAFAWYGTGTNVSLAGKNTFTQPTSGIDNKPYPYVRFEIAVADNTVGGNGGRTQQLFWNSNADTQYSNSSAHGYMKLVNLIGADDTQTATPLLNNSKVKAFYVKSQDVLFVSDYSGRINIYDVVGKIILSTELTVDNQIINLSSLSKGVYVASGNGFSSKFIK